MEIQICLFTVILTFSAVRILIILTTKVIILHNILHLFQELLVVAQVPHHMGIHHLHLFQQFFLYNSFSDEQSLLHHVQLTMASQGQSGISQFEQF